MELRGVDMDSCDAEGRVSKRSYENSHNKVSIYPGSFVELLHLRE